MQQHAAFLAQCLSIDIEVDPGTARIFDLAAVPGDGGPAIRGSHGQVNAALDQVESRLDHTRHLIGHNILRHDLPHLTALRPRLARAAHAQIDTLWLNPLAFPRNPYHHLVKQYHDGRLLSGHVNEPEADARLVFDVLCNQMDAFRDLHLQSPHVLAAYHFLTAGGTQGGGFDAVFCHVRKANAPPRDAASHAIARVLSGHVCVEALGVVMDQIVASALQWPRAYAMEWTSASGGDSVVPPWVRMQFPDAARMVKRLRDTACAARD